MTDWFYKATVTKLDQQETKLLAWRGFLCRSAYNDKGAWIANVQDVAFGDHIHFYFSSSSRPFIGTFEVVDLANFNWSRASPTAADFTGPVAGCTLYEVIDERILEWYDQKEAYQKDPVLGKFTGWLIRYLPKHPLVPPPPSFFSGRATLVRR